MSYSVPVIAAVACTFTWFRPGAFIASGDTSPFVRNGQLSEYGWLWNHRLSGAGSTSAGIARVFDVFVIRAVGVFGGSEMVAQHVLYALLFALAAFGTAFLARAFTDRPFAVAAAGLVGAFNPYFLVNLPNPLPFVAVGVFGLLAGLVLRAARAKPIKGLQVAVASLPAAYLAANPPLLAVVIIAVLGTVAAATTLTEAGGTRRAMSLIARAAPWVVLLNVWWVVPFVQATSAGAGVEFSAQTDVPSWAWSHAHNDISNVLTLNAQWGWSHPEYFPFAARLDEPPWVWLRWMLPLAAFAAPFTTSGRRRWAAMTLAGAALALIFLGKGLHPPLTPLNLWLYDHLPGLWLLREPMSKIGALLVPIYTALIAITATTFIDAVKRMMRLRQRVLAATALTAALTGMLIYPYPLWAGTAIAGRRPQLPPARVVLPQAWRDAAAYVNASSAAGKALILPIDTFYQVTTTWRYHGADDLVRQLLRRPVIQQLPGGYFTQPQAFDALTSAVEGSLLNGNVAGVPRLLQALGVSHVLLRHDLVDDNAAVLKTADPTSLGDSLRRVPGLRLARSFGVVDVFEVAEPAAPAHVYTQLVAIERNDSRELAAAIPSLDADQAAVTSSSRDLEALSWQVEGTRLYAKIDLARTTRYQLSVQTHGEVSYKLRVLGHGADRMLELSDSVVGSLDRRVLPARPTLLIPLAPEVIAVRIGHQVRLLDSPMAPVVIGPDTPVVTYGAASREPSLAGIPAFTDCNAVDARTPRQAGLRLEVIQGRIVRLRAASHSACLSAPARGQLANSYLVRISTRSVRGETARICVWQFGPDRCAALPQPARSSRWERYSALFEPSTGTIALRLHVYADAPLSGETVTEYRDAQLFPLKAISVSQLSPLPPQPEERMLSSGSHEFQIQQTQPASALGSFSALGDCAATDSKTLEESGLAATVKNDLARLGARAHSACVSAPVNGFEPSRPYRLSLSLRTVSGRTARICVWQEGPNRCAITPDLRASPNWSHHEAVVWPAPGTTALRMFLYADGQRNPETITEYRHVYLRPETPVTLTIQRSDTSMTSPPQIRAREIHPGTYTVGVRNAHAPFLLGLPEAYATGWQIHGLPHGIHATHLRIDGYANAWWIRGRGNFTVVLTYAPAAWSRRALFASAGSAIVACGVGLIAIIRRRRRCDHASTQTVDHA